MPDISSIRSQFPILDRTVYKRPLVYLDNAASTQAPMSVVHAIEHVYTHHRANVHRGVHCLSQEATQAMESARTAVTRFINAPSTDQVIFTSGTTASINLVASSYGSLLSEGDEIILTVMEHHANIVPWQLLQQRRRVVIKVVPILPDGSLDFDAYRALFTPRTRLVSVAHVSNVLGTVNPVKEIVAEAHRHGCVAVVDGAQAISHIPVDVQDIDADFYAFSAHKMYGPTGVGVLYGRRDLLEKMPPWQGGGEMIGHVSFEGTTWAELPYKFEAGTPNYIDIAATTAAIEFIESVGFDTIHAQGQLLLDRATEAMLRIPGMRIFGTAPDKAPVISFLVGHEHHYDMGTLLDRLGIAVRTGHHCAQPLMHALGIEGTVRASFAVYNTEADVDAFIDALHRAHQMLG